MLWRVLGTGSIFNRWNSLILLFYFSFVKEFTLLNAGVDGLPKLLSPPREAYAA